MRTDTIITRRWRSPITTTILSLSCCVISLHFLKRLQEPTNGYNPREKCYAILYIQINTIRLKSRINKLDSNCTWQILGIQFRVYQIHCRIFIIYLRAEIVNIAKQFRILLNSRAMIWDNLHGTEQWLVFTCTGETMALADL